MPGELYVFDKVPAGYRGYRAMGKAFVPLLPVRKCTGVCPQGIDGRQVVLNMRCEQVEENGGCLREEGYTGLLREKVDYLYRNYDNGTRGSVLFAGCSFPSYFPETTKRLAALLKEKAGIGIVFDCCGKPVAELGLREDAGRIIERIDRKLTELHIDEVIMVCPNCYAYLKDRLTARVITIYEKLAELGIGRKISGKTKSFRHARIGKNGRSFPISGHSWKKSRN